jgi:glucokinase-like ROK family protein
MPFSHDSAHGGVSESHLDSLVAVLDEIRRADAVSRPQLVARVGLSRAVVAQRVLELVERGLVEEGDSGPSSGGRAPRLLHLRAEAGRLLVADLGATSVDAAVTDLGGKVLRHTSRTIDVAEGPELVLKRVLELFDLLEEDLPPDTGPLWGIGIGVPGPVDFTSGCVVSPPIMPGWDEYPIRTRFAAYGVPVWIDNDVNVHALGELRVGAARRHRTVVHVKIGTGIGAGLIIGGQIHRGIEGSAGDVGHIQVAEDSAVVCRCGKVGCLEALAGGAAIARLGVAAAFEGQSKMLARVLAERGELVAQDVGWAATHGDPASLQIIVGSARLVGSMLATLVNVLNPSLILVGGGVAGVGDVLLATIRQTVYARSLPLATRNLSIQRSMLGDRVGVIGAAAMVADQLFSRELLGCWLEHGAPVGRLELAGDARQAMVREWKPPGSRHQLQSNRD